MSWLWITIAAAMAVWCLGWLLVDLLLDWDGSLTYLIASAVLWLWHAPTSVVAVLRRMPRPRLVRPSATEAHAHAHRRGAR